MTERRHIEPQHLNTTVPQISFHFWNAYPARIMRWEHLINCQRARPRGSCLLCLTLLHIAIPKIELNIT